MSDDREAARLYKLAADQGAAWAQFNLGLYAHGRGGLPKDDREAARLFKFAAEQGYAKAQYNLGVFYMDGRGGLPKDDREAARLYKLSADQEHAYGQDNLGLFYAQGRGGLPQNDREAARLYKLAAYQGDAWAQANLGVFYMDGRGGVPKDDREALRLYKLAADQGNAWAQGALTRRSWQQQQEEQERQREAAARAWRRRQEEAAELFIHVDRKNALGKLLFTGGLGDAFEERFASAIAEARSHRKQHARSRAWLVTDAFLLARLGQGTSRELPEFAVSIDSVSEETREDLERLADSALGRVTAGLSITLGESKFPNIKRVAAANYSLRPGYPGLTYELRVEYGSPTLSISSPADEELIATLTDCIGRLPALGVETALRLHKIALEESDDHLRSFIAAWASLEIFANKMFRANFTPAVLSSLGLGDSGWEGELCARLTRNDAQKLGIEDQFAFLAVWLSKNSAEADIQLFARLNGDRNDLYHRGVVARRLPIRDAISFFRKYLALELARRH